jgi:hypothetical protein
VGRGGAATSAADAAWWASFRLAVATRIIDRWGTPPSESHWTFPPSPRVRRSCRSATGVLHPSRPVAARNGQVPFVCGVRRALAPIVGPAGPLAVAEPGEVGNCRAEAAPGVPRQSAPAGSWRRTETQSGGTSNRTTPARSGPRRPVSGCRSGNTVVDTTVETTVQPAPLPLDSGFGFRVLGFGSIDWFVPCGWPGRVSCSRSA